MVEFAAIATVFMTTCLFNLGWWTTPHAAAFLRLVRGAVNLAWNAFEVSSGESLLQAQQLVFDNWSKMWFEVDQDFYHVAVKKKLGMFGGCQEFCMLNFELVWDLWLTRITSIEEKLLYTNISQGQNFGVRVASTYIQVEMWGLMDIKRETSTILFF